MERAYTQYTDVEGTAAADFHGGGVNLHALAKAAGINTDRFIPVGLSLTGPEEHVKDLMVSAIYVVDRTRLRETTVEAIRDYLLEHPDAVTSMEPERDVDVQHYLKRLHVVVTTRGLGL
jgi:hypothetical protein